MHSIICEDRLEFLSAYHKLILNKHFEHSSQTLQACEVAIKLGIKYSQAVKILIALRKDSSSQSWSLIYHTCSEAVVQKIPFEQGMPMLPYSCPYCEEVIYSYDELQLDMMIEVKEKIKFV